MESKLQLEKHKYYGTRCMALWFFIIMICSIISAAILALDSTKGQMNFSEEE
jgi:hypothetical protein